LVLPIHSQEKQPRIVEICWKNATQNYKTCYRPFNTHAFSFYIPKHRPNNKNDQHLIAQPDTDATRL